MKRIFYLTILLLFSLQLCSQELTTKQAKEIQQKINYLDKVISGYPDEESPLSTITEENPEWELFSLAYTTYALHNLVLQDSAYLSTAKPLMQKCIQAAQTRRIFSFYTEKIRHSPDEVNSVVYLGHFNLMLGCYFTTTHDSSVLPLYRAVTRKIRSQHKAQRFPFFAQTPLLCLLIPRMFLFCF